MTVLIMGSAEFPEHRMLGEAVTEAGGSVEYYDTDEWPDLPHVTCLSPDGRSESPLPSEDVTGVYAPLYDLLDPKYDQRFDDRFAENWRRTYTVQQDYRWALLNYLRILEDEGATVLPGFEAQFAHDSSAWQLHRFAENGLPVPETVVTDDPDEVRAIHETAERVVYKPLATRMPPKELTDDDITPERLAKLTTAPVVFQEFVPGRDLRIYVVNSEVVGGFHYRSDRLSFKWSLVDGEEVPVERVDLSESIRESARRAASLAGLEFAAVDVIDRPGDGHAVLEANPSPRFSVPQSETDADIAGAVAAMLTED
ncbi:ATP-grasp domain-containing protein [Halorussus lipolyticus]|uniref:ATP-grasp domain-containing protein n=1 Tax=Halorussus lipolyticus TaxID=3034024 RepID=UPI0023E81207|nr:hypothetical protein [Halorussus sp. DT80]